MIAYTHYTSDPRVRREAEALAERGDHVTCWCLEEDRPPADEDLRVELHVPRLAAAGA